ncbi:MAG: hypothetical protein QNJ30_02415 [Kiloniellales bacterium]|nr:hypothetical protein [Kiloniellales bacterium]
MVESLPVTAGSPTGRALGLPATAKGGSRRGLWMLILALPTVAACSVLPTTVETAESPWESFEDAKTAYDAVVPTQTTRGELTALGYDPLETPNVRVLSYVDLIQRFLPRESIEMQALDPDLRRCLEARERCWGYEVTPSVIDRSREGNVALDLFGFRRETMTTGWRFSAVIVLMDDVVQYKIWEGTPKIREQKVETKPLGPLQELDNIIQPRPIPVP